MVSPRLHFTRNTSPFAPFKQIARHWSPSLATWGVGAGTAALFLLSVTPVVREGIMVKIPVLGAYYEDKVPASDKPF